MISIGPAQRRALRSALSMTTKRLLAFSSSCRPQPRTRTIAGAFGACQEALLPRYRSLADTLDRNQQLRSMVVVSQHKSTEPTEDAPEAADPPPTMATADAATNEQQQLIITPACWNRIRQLVEKKNQSLDDVYLRVFVDAGGCSGFEYQFELDEEELDDGEDLVFYETGTAESGVARVVIDDASLDLMRGSTIDYVQEMIKSSFEVKDNPLSESACGCGSSFALKNFAANPALD